MTTLLYIAAFFAFAIGVLHSALGERYILIRLFRRDDLPKLFGDSEFTVRTLRFAWHITTIAWWGFAAILVLLAERSSSFQNLAMVLAATFLATGTIALVASRGRHLSWPVFLFIGGVGLFAAIA
ncbi:MAG: hypothetical protein O6946_04630 [Gammaproteobacteria bacterium]|nr:hypothetical protein [Gammaproteobacteria bacterium]MCZ6716336.1 hypothetical protein [Gammaproteobacteria bacterium]MCZ6826442.1 hypothetical protein [Gammaproteobacteria bacterium]